MQILILRSNPIHPDPRVEKIARVLVGQGYKVTCLGWDRSASLPGLEERDGYTIIRLAIRAEYGSGMQNFPALLRWQLGLLRWLGQHKAEFEIIHACDFDTIIPAMVQKWLNKITVIYDIFDFYADHLRRTPFILKKIIKKLDLWLISKADAVILVDEARTAQIAGSHPRRLEFIYNSPEEISLQEGEDVQPSERSSEGLRIAYIGLLQRERGLFEMLEVLKARPSWHLDIAGFGGDEKEIVAAAGALQNVRWHGRVSYDLALALSKQADVLFATYDPAIENHRYSSPNKVFEAMMLGKPIVVARGTNMDRMIINEDCGLVVTYGDVPELIKALDQLVDAPGLAIRLGTNARKAYDNKYSWQVMSNRLIKLYNSFI